MTSIDERLDEPYRLSGPGAAQDMSALPVTIDNRAYLIDTSRNTPFQERFRRSSLQLLNTQQNIDKGESALTPPEVWRRLYQSWHHGAGQRFADRENSDPYRFYTSKGIDVWDQWEMKLLHDTRLLDTTTADSGLVADEHLVVLSADRTALRVLHPVDEGYTPVSQTIPAPARIVTTGKIVYVLADNLHLYKCEITHPSGITWTDLGTLTLTGVAGGATVDLLAFVNFTLLAATSDGKVWDITAALKGTFTIANPIKAADIPGYRWVSACTGKKAAYLLGGTGDRWSIHSFAAADDTLAFRYGSMVAELPDGEVGHCLYSYLGYVAIGTSRGFRFAATAENTAVTYGPLIETPSPVLCFEGQGRFLYYGLSRFDAVSSGIGRADLSQFTADLQPAYASDLMTTSQQDTRFVVFADGKMTFGLADGGVFVEDDPYLVEGKIVMSTWTFNVSDPKVGLYAQVQIRPGSNGSGDLSIIYNQDGDERFLGSVSGTIPRQNVRFDLNSAVFNNATLVGVIKTCLARDCTPVVTGAELRASYVRGTASEWQVPCILHDEIEQDNGTVQARDVIDDFEHLLSLVQSGRHFVYTEDDQRWSVYATDFIWSPHERSVSKGWQGVFTIYFREVR